jgi:hypothetical protein
MKRIAMFLFVFLVFFMVFSCDGDDDWKTKLTGKGSELYRGDKKIGDCNLSVAFSYIRDHAVYGDEFFIYLGRDESVSNELLNCYPAKKVGITLLGNGSERKIFLKEEKWSYYMFSVSEDFTLTLGENITLVGLGSNDSYSSLISVRGNLIMNDSAKITGNASGGVSVEGGTFTMNGGEISGNTASYNGGGVYVQGGTFTMNGGIINGNTANQGGGGVSVSYRTFIMSGVEFVHAGTFTMNGGTISGNTASFYGGGVCVDYRGTFTKSGGIITGYDDITNGNKVVRVNPIQDCDFIYARAGHAVRYSYTKNGHSYEKKRDNTAGPDVNLDSSKEGYEGGWENNYYY